MSLSIKVIGIFKHFPISKAVVNITFLCIRQEICLIVSYNVAYQFMLHKITSTE